MNTNQEKIKEVNFEIYRKKVYLIKLYSELDYKRDRKIENEIMEAESSLNTLNKQLQSMKLVEQM